jgi:tetratricopeptide (TPR) repeat protein
MPIEPRAGAGAETIDGPRSIDPAKPGVSNPGAGLAEYGLRARPSITASAEARLIHASDRQALAQNQIAQAEQLFLRGDLQAALERYREAVRLQPQKPDFHYRLASIAEGLGQTKLMMRHLHETVRINPHHAAAHALLGEWFYRAGNPKLALHHSGIAVGLDSSSPRNRVSRAVALEGAGEVMAAWKLIEPIVARNFDLVGLPVLYARLAPKIGRQQQALEVIQSALSLPSVANWVASQLNFSAAGLLDQMGRYDEAFAHAQLANRLAGRKYDPKATAAQRQALISYFTRERLQSLARATHGSRRPVFIVGMPRSGTSLVEQILASHPEVFGAGELEKLGVMACDLADAPWAEGNPYPSCLDSLSVRAANQVAGQYLGYLEGLNSDALYVTDKMPSNYLVLELIELLFPRARVIHCVRDPLDTCLSCYFTDFGAGQDFAFDLQHLGQHYRTYQQLMNHRKQALSIRMIEVRYEELVRDPENQTRRMLQFLHLPWDQRCLNFHETRRFVLTASKHQVRRPIYTSSIGRWRHYARHLGKLTTALGDSLPTPTLRPCP